MTFQCLLTAYKVQGNLNICIQVYIEEYFSALERQIKSLTVHARS